jgi:lysine 2,3-aminomutase
VELFPNLPASTRHTISRHTAGRRLQITPYYLRLVRRTPDGTQPLPEDPLWRVVVPYWDKETVPSFGYDGETENWEMQEEMVTPIAQHKYDNRIIVRLSNVCHAYCQFCYEALRTLEKHSSKDAFRKEHWEATLAYIREHHEVEEVILSGGEPLMLADEQLRGVLTSLRQIDRPVSIRIHTRALTFNPFRITDELVETLHRIGVAAVGVHVTHPNELTPVFQGAVARLRQAGPILFANIPLLRGINDSVETMHALGMQLYNVGVIPHYLYHFMPYSPGASEFCTPVQSGIDLVRRLKRRVSNLAVPEFVIPHRSGKHSLPLLAEGESPPQRALDPNGQPVIRYTNWKNEVVEYPDLCAKGG